MVYETNAGISPPEGPMATTPASSAIALCRRLKLSFAYVCEYAHGETPCHTGPPFSPRSIPKSASPRRVTLLLHPPQEPRGHQPPARRSPFLIASSTVRALNYGVAQASTRPNPPTHHLDMRPARIYAMYISNQAIL